MRRLLAAAALALSLAALSAPAALAAGGAAAGSPDVFSWGRDVTVAQGETLERDVVCVFCSIRVDGSAARDVVAIGGSVYVSGSVGRDVSAVGGNVELGPGARVERDVVAVGGQVRTASGAQVGRNTVSGGPAWPAALGGRGLFSPLQAAPALLLLAVALLLGLALPRQLEAASLAVERRPLEAAGFGCLSLFAAFLVSALLAVTVILLPLAFLVWLLVAAAWLFGWAAVIGWAGRRVMSLSEQPPPGSLPLTSILVGGLLLAVALLVPVLNALLFLLGGLLAVGAALGSLFGTRAEGEPFYRGVAPAPPAPLTPPAPPA